MIVIPTECITLNLIHNAKIIDKHLFALKPFGDFEKKIPERFLYNPTFFYIMLVLQHNEKVYRLI